MKRMIILTITLAGLANAADQSITLDATPCVFEKKDLTAEGLNWDEAKLDSSKADGLITKVATCGVNSTPASAKDSLAPAPDPYYIIHVLRYKDAQMSIDQSNWYVFRKSWLGKSEWAEIPSGSYLSKYFSGKRIHGSADVRLLYLHLNISGLRRDSTEFQKVRADVEKVNPKPLVRKDTKLRLARFGDYQIAKGFEQIVYKVSVIQKLPSNIQNLKDGFGVLHSESTAPAEVDTESVALGNVQQIKIAHIPSDVTVTGFAGQVGDQKELEKQTFSNEGKHWWDVGFTLPVREFRAIDYDRESGTITGKEVTRQNLFGTFNLYLPPVDTERTIFRWLPHLLYGLPIQGKVLQRHLVGLGIGLNKAEVFAGVTFDQTRRPLAGSANALETRWIRRFTFGVNIPVRSAINALKPAKDKK